ncbi:MAG: energy transducer TonB [Flavobacteriales bacterium]
MKAIFIILSILFSGISFSQSKTTGFKAEQSDVNQKILEKGRNYDVNFDIDNHDAFYLDGEEALFMEIYKNLKIPQSAIDAALDAMSMISFKVNFNGKVLDPTSISKVGHGIDEQIQDILKTLEFVPATQGGTAYRSEVVIEIPIKARYIADAFKK